MTKFRINGSDPYDFSPTATSYSYITTGVETMQDPNEKAKQDGTELGAAFRELVSMPPEEASFEALTKIASVFAKQAGHNQDLDRGMLYMQAFVAAFRGEDKRKKRKVITAPPVEDDDE